MTGYKKRGSGPFFFARFGDNRKAVRQPTLRRRKQREHRTTLRASLNKDH